MIFTNDFFPYFLFLYGKKRNRFKDTKEKEKKKIFSTNFLKNKSPLMKLDNKLQDCGIHA